MERHWDVLVVGAGVAGGLAALDCARRGLRVLLVEKRAFPRWKVCGCCFNAQALAVLAAVGQEGLIDAQGGVPLQRLRLGLKGRQSVLGLPAGRALSRERFDQALVEAAVAAGATVRFQSRATLEEAAEGWRMVRLTPSGGGLGERVQARVVLVAGGLVHHALAASSTAPGRISPRSRLGAGCLLQADRADQADYAPGTIHMAIGSGGYVGLVRREDGALNLAAALDRGALAVGCGAGGAVGTVLREAGFALPEGLESGRWQLTPPLTRRAAQLAGERCLVLGDAAGYVEPFTGEGMAWALTAAAAATPFVLAAMGGWTPELEHRWQQRLEGLIGRRQRICRSLAWLLRQPLPCSALFSFTRRWPALPERIVASLNHVSLPPVELPSCP